MLQLTLTLSLVSALLSAMLFAALLWRPRAKKDGREVLVSRLTRFIVVGAIVVVALNLARFGLGGDYFSLIAAGIWGVVLGLEVSQTARR
jgi:hypothetical protein